MEIATTEAELSLTVTREIKASPERVYNAWLDPRALQAFMLNCQGITMRHAETDPRVGGSFVIEMGGKDSDPVRHIGTYLAPTPFRHIAFTWQSPYSTAENSTVTLDLTAKDAGTLITLTHRRFANAQSRDGHQAGWATILDALAAGTL